ncbi:zinc metallochaperone AztD [Microbacterium esteraromaticum]|uniref:zinc metallochaperone AztD n=1 Tax=Microbacterium esteraromaticum TaxID=57043 RepID=UPI001C94EC2D|nr:zinc metallochaperone AztD [Microbacterium esteraromaticum]MBY6060131.1 hypothetical protein [Microbacterium esteraromaticum]
MKKYTRTGAAVAALAGVSLLVAACASPADAGDAAAPASDSAGHEHSDGRVAVAFEGGVAVLDAETLEVIEEFEAEEFIRLNPFGDGRTVAVTTSEGFQLLDTATPQLTDFVFPATAPGHVVPHEGRTALYDDGTGTTTILDTDTFADGYDVQPETSTYVADDAHHGVSIVLEDGLLLTTVGDETSRSGAVALHPHDDHWHDEATSDQCPGIHGEGTAQDEAVVFGCENGALLFVDEEFVKLDSPDEFGRVGNMFVSETSPIAVGDYKNDPDAEGYLLDAVTLIDTAARTLDVVELPDEVRYTFRDIARGPGDLAYILSADGQIHVLDPESGELTAAYPVVAPWESPAQWQEAHPAIKVHGDIAYVTEPAADAVHAVDLTSGDVIATVTLGHTPNEIALAIG